MWADWTFLFLSFSSCVLTNYSAAHASFPCCLCCPIRLTSRSAPKLYTPSYPPASSQPGLAPTALSPDSQGMRGLSLPTRPARQWPPGTHPDPGWLGAGGEETDSPSSSEGLVAWRWVRCLRPPQPQRVLSWVTQEAQNQPSPAVPRGSAPGRATAGTWPGSGRNGQLGHSGPGLAGNTRGMGPAARKGSSPGSATN